MHWKFWQREKAPAPPVPERKEPSLRIPENVLAQSRRVPKQPSAFDLTRFKPPPGVVPQSAPDMALDADVRAVSSWASGLGLGDGMHWLGYAYLAELSQRPEYRRMSEVKAKEMTRKWIRLQAAADQNESDRVKLTMAALRRLKVQDAFRRAAEIDGLNGRSHIYIDTGMTDNPAELRTELSVRPEKIGRRSLKALKVVEPIWTYPGVYNSIDPLRQDFYKPQTWWVMGKEVHASRLLTFVGHEMPDLLKPAYQFGGLSLTQMAKPYVDWWLRDRTSVSDLVRYFSTSVLKTNMAARMQDREGEGLIERIEAFVNFRNNRGVLAVDKDSEDFVNVSAQLGTLDKLQAQAQEHICSAIGMPLLKYTGLTPSGLNVSSEGEIRSWYDDIAADQKDLFADNLDRLIRIIQLSEFGDIDEDITHDFISLWQLDEAGQAAVQKTKADTAAVYMQEGVISPEEERERLAGDPDSLYSGVDLSDPAPGPPEDDEGSLHLGDPAEHIASGGMGGSESGANSGV